LAQSYARIHYQNLLNWGVVPLFIDEADYKRIQPNDIVSAVQLHRLLAAQPPPHDEGHTPLFSKVQVVSFLKHISHSVCAR
jgi:aconitase A